MIFPLLDSQTARTYLGGCLSAPQTIAPLPRIAAQLAELTANPDTEGAQFARLIQTDPALAGEVMRVANSPALRPRSPIVSLHQAIAWLGIAEVRNIAMAVMLHGEIFVAPGHEPECEELWREAWLAGLWAKEIARMRRKQVESAFLAALMHRTGAALALKLLSRFEFEQRTAMDVRTFHDLVSEFEPACGRMLMGNWRISEEVQDAASDWREYRGSAQSDLAGTVHAAHLLAQHTLYPQLLGEEIVLESAVFEELGVFPEDRRLMLQKRDDVRAFAGL
jgi:HD-like signal output (HDOD) protein